MENLTPEELARLGLVDVDPNTLKHDLFRPDMPFSQNARIQERRTLVLTMLRRGASKESIVRLVQEKGLGSDSYGVTQVNLDFRESSKVYSHQSREDVLHLQALESDRLNFMYSRIYDGIMKGVPAAVTCGIAISKRRSGLFGLDQEFLNSVDEQVRSELSGFLDLLQTEMSGDEYQKVLMIIAGKSTVVSDRIQTIEVDVEA